MSDIEDFYAEEIKIVEATLQERYGKLTTAHQADTEPRMDPTVPTPCHLLGLVLG